MKIIFPKKEHQHYYRFHYSFLLNVFKYAGIDIEYCPSTELDTTHFLIIIDGKEVPIIKCPTKVTIKNKITGTVYASEQEALADVADPNTTTTQADIAKDVAITVAHLSLFGETK